MKEIDLSEFCQKIYTHRWARNAGEGPEKESAEYWNEKAEKFAKSLHSPSGRKEVLDFLDRFKWDKDETVLDIGAGPGSYAIPLAKKVSFITATDLAGDMLALLDKQAKTEQVKNIETIQGRWLDIELSKKFDTVLSLNSLGVSAVDSNNSTHLDKALEKLRDVTNRRLIILIPHADSVADSEMRRDLGLSDDSIQRRRIACLYAALVDKGMLSDLNIIKKPVRWTFENIQEAVTVMARKISLEDQSKRELLKKHLSKRLINENNKLVLNYKISQALFYWVK